MKKFLSSLLILSIGCTCLVTSTFANAVGSEAPCHHGMDMADGENKGKKHCCEKKQTAWKEVAEADEEIVCTSVRVTLAPFVTKLLVNYAPKSVTFAKKTKAPPNETLGWNNIQLRL